MTRHRFEAYLDKVFGFSDLVSALPEGRQFPQHAWKKVFDAVFLGAAMQIPSLLQIEAECHHGALAKRIGPVSDDTLGYSLERQSPQPVFALSCEIARRLKRNRVLRSDWSRGLVVGAVDGIEICSSFVRCCDACMEREVQHKVNGEMQTDIQYYHRIVVVVLVSTDFPIPLGVRFQKNGEAEVACALALLQDLVGQLGRRFLDVLVGDALYLQAPFVKEVERLGLVWAFTLKENQPELLREAERLTQESPPGIYEEPGREIRYWHLPELDWPVADRLVRVVKTVRIEHQRCVTVSEKDAHRTKGKTEMSQQSTNFYATNFELGLISPLFIHQFSRSRWRIDTEVFQTITTDCHLKHPAVHQTTALVVLTMIRFLAYTLSLVFYHRQVRSHARRKCDTFHELAKRLAYWFLAVSPIPVDPAARAWPSSCPAIFPGVAPDAMTPYSFRLEKSSGFAIPRASQLAPASLLAITGVKSAAYSMGRWRFTESLRPSQLIFTLSAATC